MQPRRRRRKIRNLARREAERAWQALEEGNLQLAFKEIERAVARAGDSAAVWTDYARLLTAAGRLGEAERAARRALALAPEHADAHAQLAEILSRKGLTIQAYRSARRAVELSPGTLLFREILRAAEAGLPPDYGGRD